MEVLLDGGQVEKLAGLNSIVLTYPELYNYKSIKQLFSKKISKVIILYLQEANEQGMSGHWCLLTKRDNTVEFFDSYSLMPDSQLKWNNKAEKEELNQKSNYLTKLLYDYCKSGGTVLYNEMRFQKKDPTVNTCGRFVGLRAHFHDIPLKKYQQIFKNIRKKGFNLDEVSVFLSDELLR